GRTEPRGVVDENVDTAESVGGFGDVARNGRGMRQVADRGMGHPAMPGDLVAGGGERFGAAGANRHTGPGLREGQCDGASDAAAASSDNGALAGNIDLHASSSGSLAQQYTTLRSGYWITLRRGATLLADCSGRSPLRRG